MTWIVEKETFRVSNLIDTHRQGLSVEVAPGRFVYDPDKTFSQINVLFGDGTTGYLKVGDSYWTAMGDAPTCPTCNIPMCDTDKALEWRKIYNTEFSGPGNTGLCSYCYFSSVFISFVPMLYLFCYFSFCLYLPVPVPIYCRLPFKSYSC
jgi:hypothetical protein